VLENTASELRKNSVPLLFSWYIVPGTVAGQTVNPAPSGPMPSVLNSNAVVAVPATSAAFEITYTCEP